MKVPASFVITTLVGVAVASLSAPAPRNFIYIVPDGYGTASQALARDYVSIQDNKGTADHPGTVQLGADPLVIGSVRTQSSDALVTDSAASATAFSCGVKTYNGAISVDDDGRPVASVLEAAHLNNFKTGLVATSRISHATPACYAAHVLHRDCEDEIAGHEIGYSHPMGSVVDLMMGGGRRHFLPSSDGGKREDGVNLIDWAKDKGFTYVATKKELTSALDGGKTVPLPFLGLFSSSHMSYELDRDDTEQPSLVEMTKIALASLEEASSGSDKGTSSASVIIGYFVMIEASRIDHAGHANDAAGHVHDTVMYNKVMSYVKEYIDSHPDTQMLSAADHECGGLTLESKYNPAVLQKVNSTTEALARRMEAHEGDKPSFVKTDLMPTYGLSDISADDVKMLLKVLKDKGTSAMGKAAGRLLASEAGLHWSTTGHTAADVLLHGYANKDALVKMREAVGKSNDNTDLPMYIEKVLGLNLSDATAALRANGSDWVGERGDLRVIKRANNAYAHHHD